MENKNKYFRHTMAFYFYKGKNVAEIHVNKYKLFIF